MARTARLVLPGFPHHVTHRGHQGQPVFVTDQDRQRYLLWLSEHSSRCGLSLWAYCLMSNHVHLIAVPATADALAHTVGAVHTRHAQAVNDERGVSGHLWHGRYYSCPLDAAHLWDAVRYVERNPVRAGLVTRAEKYPWSSAAGRVSGRGDALVRSGGALAAEVSNWRRFLSAEEDEETLTILRRHGRTGRPWADPRFLARLEKQLSRRLVPRRAGRPRKGQ